MRQIPKPMHDIADRNNRSEKQPTYATNKENSNADYFSCSAQLIYFRHRSSGEPGQAQSGETGRAHDLHQTFLYLGASSHSVAGYFNRRCGLLPASSCVAVAQVGFRLSRPQNL